MDEFRALCAELLSVFYDYDDESSLAGIFDDMKANGNDLLDRARAALAEPEPKVAEPTYSEVLAIRDELDANGYGTVDLVAFARAVLARYGHQPAPPAAGKVRKLVAALRCEAVAAEGDPLWMSPSELRRAADLLQQHQAAPVPVPPAEGEVAELVAWLRSERHLEPRYYARLTSAADLLELLSDWVPTDECLPPTPIPVSERLPGPGDCDAEGRFWAWCKATKEWCLRDRWHYREESERNAPGWASGWPYWLPANALPLPAGEVE